MSYEFPKDFKWGVATASYQIEGATSEDGRGESIWDRFARTPGKVMDQHNGDVACDHYHLWKSDIKLMKSMGVQAYRFSTAWPRIIPTGDGAVNPLGLDFYDKLVDGLLEEGIEPFLTLYHWDLPQALQDKGGWLNRDIVKAYADYVRVVVARLGDRVKNWMTFNEMLCFIGLSYKVGIHAPGLHLSDKEVNQAYHHAFLAHGHGVRVIREFATGKVEVGLVNNPNTAVPVSETPANIVAAIKANTRLNGFLTEPIFRGEYAPWWLEEQKGNAPQVENGDMEIIASSCDFHGLNLYSGVFVEASDNEKGFNTLSFPKGYPQLDLEWLKPLPQNIYWACKYLREEFGTRKYYISESGCACKDEVDKEGRIIDLDRREWLRNSFLNAHRCVEEGIDLAGYFVWSLMDNYEWAEGYHKRFGIIRTDYETQKRTLKESAKWYKEVIKANRIV